jgi:hypothetical protein
MGTSPSSSTYRDGLGGYCGLPQVNQSRICCRSLLLRGGEPGGGIERVTSCDAMLIRSPNTCA